MPVELRDKEQILESINKHWIIFYWTAWLSFLIILALFFLRFYFHFTFFGYTWQVFTVVLGAMAIAILYKLYIWKNNVLLITNERLINKDQYGLFSKKVRALMFEDIVDVSYIQKGITPVMCNYGTLIFRMSSGTKVSLKTIPDPWKAVEAINKIKLSIRVAGASREETPSVSNVSHGETTSV